MSLLLDFDIRKWPKKIDHGPSNDVTEKIWGWNQSLTAKENQSLPSWNRSWL